MLGRLRQIGVRRIVLVLVIGLVVGIGAFALTSTHQEEWLGGPPYCTSLAPPGFDLWTGVPHGRVVDCRPGPLSPLRVEVVDTWPVPMDMLNRTVIPVPVGFLIGSLATAGVLALNDRRRRPDSAALHARERSP